MNTTSTAQNISINSHDFIIEGEGLWQGRLFIFESLDSTNRWVIDNLDQRRHGDVVRAVRQTKGKGRLSRNWQSPSNQCLTFSICLDETEGLTIHPVLGQMAAIAVRNVLEKYSIFCQLKWPNDIMAEDKKIAGILAETDFRKNRTVIGIGLNVNLTDEYLHSSNLDSIATSMHVETGKLVDISSLLKIIISELENVFESFKKNYESRLSNEWEKYDWLTGSDVEIENRNQFIKGRYKGLDEQGRLHMVDMAGNEHVFWTGDVRKVSKVNESTV